MGSLRRSMDVIVFLLFAASWTLTQGFCFVPALGDVVGVGCSLNERRATARCHPTAHRSQVNATAVTARGQLLLALL